MSNPSEFNSRVMQWSPRLILLTSVPNPDWHEGKFMPVYVDPRMIISIVCVKAGFAKADLSPNGQQEFHPRVDCTVLRLYGAPEMLVIESADEVAQLRDEALGYEAPKSADSPPRRPTLVEYVGNGKFDCE